jgi:hypothetical protein
MSSRTNRLLHASIKSYQLHIENFLAHFLTFFAGCSVIECEKYYQTEKDTYFLRGYIDLILKDPLVKNTLPDKEETLLEQTMENTEKYIIVDFKLKNLPARKNCTGEGEDGLSDFQLPAYITLAEENEKYKVYTALFYSIIDIKPEIIIGTISDINTKKTFPLKEDVRIIKDSKKYNLIFEEFTYKTGKFALDISGGELKNFPKNNSVCYTCNYHRICRTVYAITRENIARDYK